MTTQITTHNPVRTDVLVATGRPGTTAPAGPSRAWALAGVGAAVTTLASGVAAGMVNAVYDPAISDDADAVLSRLGDFTAHMVAFQVLGSISALLLAVFGVGLYRRLRSATGPAALAPALAAFGLLATSVVLVMGTSLNTEFAFAVAADGIVIPEAAVFYNHWIGTVPACWLLAGLSALAVWNGARRGDVPRWLGRVGLVLGALTLLVGTLPVQYMAGLTGALWLLVTALGFTFGDKVARRA
jgi:hypothetical protein